MKIKIVIAIILFIICWTLFSKEEIKREDKTLEEKVVFVNTTQTFKFKEDSINDGFKWYINTPTVQTNYQVKNNTHKSFDKIQKNVDEFEINFSSKGKCSIVFEYRKIKDNKVIKYHVVQPVKVIEDINLTWYTNFEEAKNKAKEEKKIILLFFTGSDWCGACKGLNENIFQTKQFEKIAKQKLILVEVDFPKKKVLDDNTKRQNNNLLSRYPVKGYPTCYFITPNGEVLGKIVGYKDKFMELMEDILKIKK